MKVWRRKVFRIGVQQLLQRESDGQFFVSIQNRTYQSQHPITIERARVWYRVLS